MTVYIFLRQRPQDKEPWPCVYVDAELAAQAIGRVSEVIPVTIPPSITGHCPVCRHVFYGDQVGTECPYIGCGGTVEKWGPLRQDGDRN